MKKTHKPIGKATPKLKINQQQQTLPIPQGQTHRRLWTAAKFAAAFLGGLCGIVGTVYGIWGPLWPTKPEFVPGYPSFGLALDVPFAVTNKSLFFSLSNLEIYCGIHSVELVPGSGLSGFTNFSVTMGARNTLKPRKSAPYICPMVTAFHLSPDQKITSAQISVWGKYDSPWPWPFSGQVEFSSEIFNLNTKTNPPQWTIGEPLR